MKVDLHIYKNVLITFPYFFTFQNEQNETVLYMGRDENHFFEGTLDEVTDFPNCS